MSEPRITCPNCKTEIKLTESLAAPLLAATRSHYEQQLVQKDADIEARLSGERDRIATDEESKARRRLAVELSNGAKEIKDLKEVIEQRNAKLAEAQQAQAELVRKQWELEDARREIDLTIEKKVQQSLETIREKAKKDAEEGHQLKVREKEEQIASMQRQIEDLKRKAEQGSQQLQGEVQEIQLEALIRGRFPRDVIERVPIGESGADLLHRVFNDRGQLCGTILWETKRTRNWSDGWLAKLRHDQRAAKAEFALIVSHTLPKDMDASFDLRDGVWVAEPRCAIPVAIALREWLIALAAARQAGEGQLTKMDMIYQYLMGPRFRHRVEAVVEKFTDMQSDLDRERKTMTRLWAKREEQIRGVLELTAGMYGDLQGIAGKTLREIEGLEIPLLDAPTVSCGS